MTVNQLLMLGFGIFALAFTVVTIHPLVVEISYSQYEEVSQAVSSSGSTNNLIRTIMSDRKITGWEYLQLMQNIDGSDF